MARVFYNEQYFRAKMRYRLTHNESQLRMRFDWRFAGHDHSLAFEAEGQPMPLAKGSEPQFIADDYWATHGSGMEAQSNTN